MLLLLMLLDYSMFTSTPVAIMLLLMVPLMPQVVSYGAIDPMRYADALFWCPGCSNQSSRLLMMTPYAINCAVWLSVYHLFLNCAIMDAFITWGQEVSFLLMNSSYSIISIIFCTLVDSDSVLCRFCLVYILLGTLEIYIKLSHDLHWGINYESYVELNLCAKLKNVVSIIL